jgi:hypothetical protein
MASQLPMWVQVLQALLTPVVALLAIAIGVAQWRTSHQRAVLDLFEKRMEVHDAISMVIGGVVASGRTTAQDASAFARARQRVDLLFGPEVPAYLEGIDRVLLEHHAAGLRAQRPPVEEQSRALDAQHAAFLKLTAFFEEFPKLVKPYVKMHQKAPWF